REDILVGVLSGDRGAIDEVGDRIEAVDGETAMALGDDLLRGRRPDRRDRATQRGGQRRGTNHPAREGKPELSLTPRCGHSLANHAVIRLRFGRKAGVTQALTWRMCPSG